MEISNRKFTGECSWGQHMRGVKEEDWAAGEAGLMLLQPRPQSVPAGNSGAGMTLLTFSELGRLAGPL